MPPDSHFITQLDNAFQWLLVGLFTVASLRLFWTARHGRRNIRLFRFVGVGITAGWAVFYVMAAGDLASFAVLADISRTLQYFNVTMFLLWGFLFNEERWEEDAARRLEAAANGD